MNYHILIDDKFIDDFIADAEKVSNNNIYIYTFNQPAKFVKSTLGITAPYGSKELDNIITRIRSTDKVFIHWYHSSVNYIINQIPKATRVYILFWGGDFLELPISCGTNNLISKFLYEPLTLKYQTNIVDKHLHDFLKQDFKKRINRKTVRGILKAPFSYIKYRFAFFSTNQKRIFNERKNVLKRASAICHWNKLDIDIIEKIYNVKLNHLPFCYGVGIFEMKLEVKQKSNKTLNILLGHSDNETNNHLDTFQLLKKIKGENIKIYCPLNYGNSPYNKFIANEGVKFFGNKFIPLLDFIPRDEYYSLMNSIDVSIMNHCRTQAGGNIVALIKKGVKVYMNPKSSIFQFYQSLGATIFSNIEIPSMSFEQFCKPITSEQVNESIIALENNIDGNEIRFNNLKALLT